MDNTREYGSRVFQMEVPPTLAIRLVAYWNLQDISFKKKNQKHLDRWVSACACVQMAGLSIRVRHFHKDDDKEEAARCSKESRWWW